MKRVTLLAVGGLVLIVLGAVARSNDDPTFVENQLHKVCPAGNFAYCDQLGQSNCQNATAKCFYEMELHDYESFSQAPKKYVNTCTSALESLCPTYVFYCRKRYFDAENCDGETVCQIVSQQIYCQ